MENIQATYDKRAKLVTDMRAMLDKATAEKRSFSAEEDTQYKAMEKDCDAATDEIRAHEKAKTEELSRREAQVKREEELQRSQKPPIKPEPNPQGVPEVEKRAKEQSAAWNTYLRRGETGLTQDERRALQGDADAKGGFLLAPEQFVMQLIKDLDNMVFVRNYANVIPVRGAQSLGAPALDADPANPTWTYEIGAGSEDSTMAFEKRTLTPHPLAKYIKVSKDLLDAAVMSVDGLVRQRLAYTFAITQENAFLNGTGSGQPLGLFTASADGITTGRDVSTSNTSSLIKADNLITCVYTLKAQYRAKARWIFHRDLISQIRKLKDGNGDYLWKMGIADGQPDRILNYPVDESEYAPNTISSGAYVGIIGDLSHYWIADSMSMSIQVANELYLATNQTGYFARAKLDGMPVIENAFVRSKLG